MADTFLERNVKHECAEYAYKCITKVLESSKANPNIDIQKDYRSEVMSTGTRIHSAGLMQTLAFYCSKIKGDKLHFSKLALHIMEWILRNEKLGNSGEPLPLLELLLGQPDDKMMYFTEEAMEVTQWLKRFADARLEKEAETKRT